MTERRRPARAFGALILPSSFVILVLLLRLLANSVPCCALMPVALSTFFSATLAIFFSFLIAFFSFFFSFLSSFFSFFFSFFSIFIACLAFATARVYAAGLTPVAFLRSLRKAKQAMKML